MRRRRWKSLYQKIRFAKEMQGNPTRAERIASILLQRYCSFRFFPQYVFAGYILDFYIPEKMTAIEIDGLTHISRERYDNQRDLNLRRGGIKTIRIDNDTLFETPSRFVEIIKSL